MTLKPGPISEPPPSISQWKAQGGRGSPPQVYDEKLIVSAPAGALEYQIYQGKSEYVKPREIERRINELEEDRGSNHQRYNKSAIFYLRKKLEELILEGSGN